MSLYTVIGAGGFIGGRVRQRLDEAGAEVFAPARGDRDLFTRDLGRVVYCAGLTGDYREKPFEAVEAHVGLLARVLEQASFERLVYLSSTRLYDSLAGGVGREDAALPLDPNQTHHVYELSKALGENLALNQSDGRGAVARLSYVFDWADGAAGFLSEWLIRARASRSLLLNSSPSHARDYIHLDDVAGALRAMLDQGDAGLVNVASGRTLTNGEVAEVFRRRGWTVAFTKEGQAVAPSAGVDVGRLARLGAPARDVPGLIDSYLAALA